MQTIVRSVQLGQLVGQPAVLAPQHQAEALLHVGAGENVVGGRLVHLRQRCPWETAIAIDRGLGQIVAERQAGSGKAVDVAGVGADDEMSAGDGQAAGISFDGCAPHEFAGGDIEGHDLAATAGDDQVAGDDQLLVGIFRRAPGDASRGKLLDLAICFVDLCPQLGGLLRRGAQLLREAADFNCN